MIRGLEVMVKVEEKRGHCMYVKSRFSNDVRHT